MKLLSLKEYENLKEKNRKEWLKYCFDICEIYNWERIKIAKIAEMYNYLTEITFINNGKKYAEEYLKIVNFDSKNDYLVAGLKSQYHSTLNRLIYTEDEEEIAKIIEESKCDLAKLRQKVASFIRLFMSNLTEEEQKKLSESLNSKIKKESIKREEERKEKAKITAKEKATAKEQEKIILIESLFKPVLKNKMTDKELIRQISRPSYNRYLEALRKYSPDFYNKYMKKLEKDKQLSELMEKELDIEIKNIYNHIVNGIETEEGLRDFDMVDYYKLYGKYNNYLIDYIRNNRHKLSTNEIKTLKAFHHLNVLNDEVLNTKRINDFKETILEFNCQKDQYGYLIPNSGITISKEEKENMIKYLKDNKIPITNKTTRALINRYKANALNKPKVKIRKPNN